MGVSPLGGGRASRRITMVGRKPDFAKPTSRPVPWLCINYTTRARQSEATAASALWLAAPYRFASPCAGFEPLPRFDVVAKILTHSERRWMRNRFISASCCFEDTIEARIFVDENPTPRRAGKTVSRLALTQRTIKRPSVGDSKARAARMAQTRRIGMQNDRVQLAKAPRFALPSRPHALTPSRPHAHTPIPSPVRHIFYRATCLGRPTALKEPRTIRVDLSPAGRWAFLGAIAWPAQS
jgi:hypothetical protein